MKEVYHFAAVRQNRSLDRVAAIEPPLWTLGYTPAAEPTHEGTFLFQGVDLCLLLA